MKIFRHMLVVVFACACVSLRAQTASEQEPERSDPVFDEFHEFNDTASEAEPVVFDPLIGYNRFMFQVNDRMFIWVFEPVARGYAYVVPEQPRVAVVRFFKNLGFPIRAVNCCLQGKFKAAGIECARFGINTSIGVLGFFDPAEEKYGLEPQDEDFGQTLGFYGVGPGFPIVLPFLGLSNLRDLVSKFPDYYLDPVSYIDSTGTRLTIRIYDQENYLSLHLDEYQELKDAALDPYTFFRDAYRQNREKRISQ